MEKHRIGIVGSSRIGKSTLLSRLRRWGCDHRHLPYLEPTRESNFGVHFVPDKGVDVHLHLIDTPGQLEWFQSMPARCLATEFDAVIFLFSIDSKQSMEMLPTYMTDVSSKTPNTPPFVLLGLKADLEEQRQVTQAMAEAFAAQHGMVFLQHTPSSTAQPRPLFEVSCKTFKNLDMLGPSLLRLCREYRANPPQPQPSVETETEGPIETTAMPETTTAAEPASAEPAQPPPTGPAGVALLPELVTLCCTLM